MITLVIVRCPREDQDAGNIVYRQRILGVLTGEDMSSQMQYLIKRFGELIEHFKSLQSIDLMVNSWAMKPDWQVVDRIMGPKPKYDQSMKNDPEYNRIHNEKISKRKKAFADWCVNNPELWQVEIQAYRQSILAPRPNFPLFDGIEQLQYQLSYIRSYDTGYRYYLPELIFQTLNEIKIDDQYG